jgi:hypothetical protein
VLKIKLAVEIGLDLRACDADLEIVPLARRGRRVANPFDLGATAFLELPRHQVVFEAIGPDRQVVAVRFEIEQDAGALIDTPGQPLETDGDFSVRKSATSLKTAYG